MSDELKGKVAIITRRHGTWVAQLPSSVEPGVIASKFHDVFTKPEVRENFPSMIPPGREGEVREVAEVIALLVTNPSSYITGEAIQGTWGVVFYLRIEPRNNHICSILKSEHFEKGKEGNHGNPKPYSS